jgi:hypothetical protein
LADIESDPAHTLLAEYSLLDPLTGDADRQPRRQRDGQVSAVGGDDRVADAELCQLLPRGRRKIFFDSRHSREETTRVRRKQPGCGQCQQRNNTEEHSDATMPGHLAPPGSGFTSVRDAARSPLEARAKTTRS